MATTQIRVAPTVGAPFIVRQSMRGTAQRTARDLLTRADWKVTVTQHSDLHWTLVLTNKSGRTLNTVELDRLDCGPSRTEPCGRRDPHDRHVWLDDRDDLRKWCGDLSTEPLVFRKSDFI